MRGNCEPLRAAHGAADLEDGELRHRNAVVGEQLLGEALVARQQQAAGIAAGVRDAQQLEVADDVLIEDRDVVEVLEQVEDDVRLEVVDRLAHDAEIVADAEVVHLVAGLLQGDGDVELRLPVDAGDVDALDVLRRHQIVVHQGENAQLSHSHTRCRPLCR